MQNRNCQKLEMMYSKKNIRIAVLDSGLGGLSICAELEKRLQAHMPYERLALLYINVWPEQNRGYNSLESMSERIGVFDAALQSIGGYHPDLKNEMQTILGKIDTDPPKDAAMLRNRLTTMQHNQHWIDTLSCMMNNDLDTSPKWAFDLTAEWLTFSGK